MISVEAGDVILISRKWRGWCEMIPHNLVSYLISRRIQKTTKSAFNHVGIAISGSKMIEALREVEITPIAKYLDKNKYRIKVLRYKYISDFARQRIVDWAIRQENEKYNYVMLLKIRLVLFLEGILGLKAWILKGKIDRSVWICSELAQSAYRSQGVELAPGLMVPGDFEGLDGMRVIYDS